MSHPADAMPLVISAMSGMFPGAPDVDAFWQRIRTAETAPLTDLGPRWGVAKERYFVDKPGVPDRTYVDHAFCLPEDAGSELSDLQDRQARIGQAVLRDLLAKLPGTAPPRTGFVLATEWTGAGYFERVAHAAFSGEADIDLPPPPPTGYAPDAQLAAIAEGLSGPRFAIDTACASSLYGLDLARRLIQTGQADGVVVMGLTAWLPLFLLTSFSQLMALSPEQRILPYAANASGILLGEACAAVLVEPLANALAAGRPILAVIRRQGLSADGADRSVFAPGRDGQRLMYKRAYQDFAADSLDYLEGHGTATKLGDDTELTIMQEFFAPHYRPDQPLPIGSVKGLIGHTLAAAGITSLIKTLLMLKAKELPPHNPVTPNVALAGSSLILKIASSPWPEPADRPRRAGVSAFGFGGSNAHVVLEEYRPAASGITVAPAAKPAWRPLAIVDFDAVFGIATNLSLIRERLNRNESFGQQLPAELSIEAQGLRMGPNFLKRLDSYQLLITDLAHRISQRQPELANDANAGIVIGSNLGGALTHKILQRSLWLTHHRDHVRNTAARADRFGPRHSLESIASCLPNMCSGYPAFHLNLRAFHQTLSGGPGLFWDSLTLAGNWLQDGCQRLLIGAGRINKHAGEHDAEGAALFLLQDTSQVQQPLAILHALIPAAEAPDFASACAHASLPAEQFDWRGVCNLEEAGALGEAQGTDLLVSALLAARRWAAIEVRQGETLRYTLLLEKCAEPTLRPVRQQLPLNIALHETAPTVPKPAKRAVSGRIQPENARLWLQSTSAALHGFFASQRAGLKLLPAAPITPVATTHVLHRSSSHTVIANPEKKPDGQLAACLQLDESHPYFFDHPLDHVPGILMLEGMLQLAEWGAQPPAGQEAYVQSVKLVFQRFCEKNAPVVVNMMPEANNANRFAGTIRQNDNVACRFNLGIAYAPASGSATPAENVGERPDLKLLHKHLAENVLVTPLFDLPDGLKGCRTHTPPAGHILADGSPHYHSMLYLLETTRQFIMLIAHTIWEVPLGLPMNLLSIQLDLDAPAPRAIPLTLSHCPTRLDKHQESAIVLVETQLHAGEQRIGKATIVAQALTAEAYRKQRHETSGEQA